NDRERIVVTEIPYQVNKAKLIEKIAELVRDKRLEGISDLRDESDRKGMRIVIEIKKNENSNVILNRLFKLTQLQESFGVNLLAIYQNQPKTFNLKDMLWAFIEHRKDVVVRRTIFDLKKAEARAHILEGLKRAVENIDEVIELIKKASNPEQAKIALIGRFAFSEIQAQAILDMRLQRLTGLEREKIIEEYAEILKLIQSLKDILGSETLVFKIIKEEMTEIRENYGDARRTTIELDTSSSDFDVEDLIADEETLVTITHSGYVKRTDPSQFRAQNRGGRGVKGMQTQEEDVVTSIYVTRTLTSLFCFTDRGRLYSLKVYQVPEATRNAKGKAIVNLIALQPGEKVKAILPVTKLTDNEFITMVTRRGVIKKTALSDFKNIMTKGIIAINIDEGDELLGARITNGSSDVFLCTESGMSIRFPEEDVRATGRATRGVIGISLDEGDQVVAMETLDRSETSQFEILVISHTGFGKRTPVKEYRVQSRGGKGILTMRVSERNGGVMGARQVLPNGDVMLVSNRGQMIRINVGGISEQGRVTQGVRLMTLSDDEKLVSFETIAEEKVETPSDGGSDPTSNGAGPEGSTPPSTPDTPETAH
ncbi:MAG: DNA gyrase subunit A, partial [Proteobacteria bacterium]